MSRGTLHRTAPDRPTVAAVGCISGSEPAAQRLGRCMGPCPATRCRNAAPVVAGLLDTIDALPLPAQKLLLGKPNSDRTGRSAPLPRCGNTAGKRQLRSCFGFESRGRTTHLWSGPSYSFSLYPYRAHYCTNRSRAAPTSSAGGREL